MKKHSPVSRRIDNLGRVTLPMELRQELKIETGDRLDIFLDGKTILLQKRDPACTVCGEEHHLVEFRGRYFCQECLAALRTLEPSSRL